MKLNKHKAMNGAIHILVVEDDPEWQAALAELYHAWFPAGRQTVVDNAADARSLLRKEGADLVSLDLNLSRSPHATLEPHGLNLLRDLAKHHWARAVCVITQMMIDHHLRHFLRDGPLLMLEKLKAAPHYTLNRFLGVNGLVLHKQPEKTPAENVALFRQAVDAKEFKTLLQHAFVLSFAGDGLHQSLSARL